MKMKQMNIQRAQKGFTLIELSFVLIAIGLLIGGALAGASYLDGVKANNEAAALLRVFGNLQQKYATSAKTTSVTTANSIVGHVFDDPNWNVDTTAGTVTNQFSGAVTVAKATTIAADDGFLVTINEIPTKVCQKLIPLMLEPTYAIKVGTVVIKANPSVTPTPSAIDTECDKATNVAIALTIRKNA